MDKDIVESKRVGGIVRAVKKQCYYNAFRVIMEIPEYAKADYVEGIALSGGMLIEHGWIEKDGVIVDPSISLDEMVYFPGLRFAGKTGLAKAIRSPRPRHTEDLPIFYRFGWGGIECPDFRAAIVAAYRHLGWEETAIRYETYEPTYATEITPDGRRVLVIA